MTDVPASYKYSLAFRCGNSEGGADVKETGGVPLHPDLTLRAVWTVSMCGGLRLGLDFRNQRERATIRRAATCLGFEVRTR